jgi:hypothetical protein
MSLKVITFKLSKKSMRYFTVLFLCLISFIGHAQENETLQNFSGSIVTTETLLPLSNVHIINKNLVKGTITNDKGKFEIPARVNDTLYISSIGYKTITIKVTNDWLKFKNAKIQMTEKAYALEEVVVSKYNLTGYLEVDSKLIPIKDNHQYNISGLGLSYEAGDSSPGAFSRVMNSIFNPADLLYNTFSKKKKEMKKLREVKKDNTVRELLKTKFDRETLATLLNVEKNDIAEILEHCNYSETFIKTANDLQILDAISECYEQYKVLKK